MRCRSCACKRKTGMRRGPGIGCCAKSALWTEGAMQRWFSVCGPPRDTNRSLESSCKSFETDAVYRSAASQSSTTPDGPPRNCMHRGSPAYLASRKPSVSTADAAQALLFSQSVRQVTPGQACQLQGVSLPLGWLSDNDTNPPPHTPKSAVTEAQVIRSTGAACHRMPPASLGSVHPRLGCSNKQVVGAPVGCCSSRLRSPAALHGQSAHRDRIGPGELTVVTFRVRRAKGVGSGRS